MTATADLKDFGYREMEMAGDLLKAYAARPPDWLGDGVHVVFNTHSGYVFLTDDDFNVAMMDDDDTGLEQFLSCPECGNEGFRAEIVKGGDCCRAYAKELVE